MPTVPIEFACPGCGHRFQVDHGLAGKRFRCKCSHVGRVPSGPRDFDPFGLDEDPATPTRRPQGDGDGLLGDVVAPRVILPSRGSDPASPDVHPMRDLPRLRRKRDGGMDEAPVLGMPVGRALGIFLAGLVVLDVVPLLVRVGFHRLALALGLVTIGAHLVAVVINAGVMLVAGRICDVEVSSIRRILAIALAMAAAGSAFSTFWRVAVGRMWLLEVVLGSVISCSILSSTLGLGCMGLIGFLAVQFVTYALLGMLMRSLYLSFAARQ